MGEEKQLVEGVEGEVSQKMGGTTHCLPTIGNQGVLLVEAAGAEQARKLGFRTDCSG